MKVLGNIADVSVSIARRLQDPLAELVKIEPKHIGVGMYQVRDINFISGTLTVRIRVRVTVGRVRVKFGVIVG